MGSPIFLVRGPRVEPKRTQRVPKGRKNVADGRPSHLQHIPPQEQPKEPKNCQRSTKASQYDPKIENRPTEFSIDGPPATPGFQLGAMTAVVLRANNCTSYGCPRFSKNLFCCVNQFRGRYFEARTIICMQSDGWRGLSLKSRGWGGEPLLKTLSVGLPHPASPSAPRVPW